MFSHPRVGSVLAGFLAFIAVTFIRVVLMDKQLARVFDEGVSLGLVVALFSMFRYARMRDQA